MTRVAPVKLKNSHRTLWFDPGQLEPRKGDAVVVGTARGTELGYMADDVMEVGYEQVAELKSPLKPIRRIATEEDLRKAAEMERLSAEALPVFKEMAAEANGDMHPVAVEYLLDGEHAVFYFEAEERIDFRDLVRKLASRFHVRVDMRQIGVRDEARMVGGMGHCGQELCCKRLGGEFCPVSIRMAKEQDLSLNPQKISGVCGRLMCCLRYEFDAYKDFKQRAPKKNAPIETPEGTAKVVELDVPRETVSLKTEEGQVVKVPLAGFEPAEEGARPSAVCEQAWEEATVPKDYVAISQLFSSTQRLSGKDKLATPGAVRRTGHSQGHQGKKRPSSKSKGAQQKPASDSRKLRRRSKVATGADEAPSPQARAKKRGQVKVQGKPADQGKQAEQKKRSGQKQRRRPADQGQTPKKGAQQKRKNQPPQQKQQETRPGRKSSALRKGDRQESGEARRKQPASQSSSEGAGRRSRRRSHKAHGHEESAGNGPVQS